MENSNSKQKDSTHEKNNNVIIERENNIEERKYCTENNIVVVNDEDEKVEERNVKISSDNELNYINLRASHISKNDYKPENKIDYNDLLYKDVLFFFVNTYSGSREGLALVNMGVKKVEFVLKCSAYIFNVNDTDNYNIGIQTLKDYQASVPNSLAKIIIGGGDGSILHVIEYLENQGVNVHNCLFGVLPLGTRNDLSSTLGWGGKIDLNSDMAKFKNLVLDFAEASSILIDVWEIKLSMDPKNGEIIQVVNKDGKMTKDAILKNLDKITEFKKSFISYFSLGYDARVGFGLEKSRTKYRCCNSCLFFWENCKKTCCRKTIGLNSIIESFSSIKLEDFSNLNNSIMTQKENNGQHDLVFKTKDYKKTEEIEQVVLKGNPICLIGQNLNFYLGNSDNLWKANDKVGLEIHNPKENPKEINLEVKAEKEKEKFKHLTQNTVQNLNDSKLEFLTYQSGICGISGEKIYQGTGPVLLKFKDTPENSKDDKFSRIYLNIDGNYYHIVKPLELRVRQSTKYSLKKLKFLCKINLDD